MVDARSEPEYEPRAHPTTRRPMVTLAARRFSKVRPYSYADARLEARHAQLVSNKIVIDTNNYYPERDGHIPELEMSRRRPRSSCRHICRPPKSSRLSTISSPPP